MPKCVKFYLAENTDSDSRYLPALLDAGYIEKKDPNFADFIFDDCARGGLLGRYAKYRPYFIIPHTPQSWFFWDWSRKPVPAKCNFVIGNAAVFGMKAYGYPYRTEAIGFSRCEIREFTPTKGNDLLVIPAHSTRRGAYSQPNYVEIVKKMIGFIISKRSCFGKVTVCWNEDVGHEMALLAKTKGVDFVATNPYMDKDPLKNMIERMERADLVMGCGTAGCASVAIGRPTVFFSETGIPYISPSRPVEHAKLYLDSLRFPLMAENMSIDEILKVRTAENPRAKYWKMQNIGGQFNAEKFICIVKEALSFLR